MAAAYPRYAHGKRIITAANFPRKKEKEMRSLRTATNEIWHEGRGEEEWGGKRNANEHVKWDH